MYVLAGTGLHWLAPFKWFERMAFRAWPFAFFIFFLFLFVKRHFL